MTDLALAFCGGLLGSAHCVGMCGAFALAVGASGRGWYDNTARQCVYTLGRAFTYGCAGLTAAYLGSQLPRAIPQWMPAQAILSLFAGMVLIIQGLTILGVPWLRWRSRMSLQPCQAASAFRQILMAPNLTAVFLAGVATGFLPCALIYAYLALAAQSGSLLSGMLIMVAVALGTAPLMMLTGLGMSSLHLKTRQQILQAAAVLVLLTGIAAVLRGGAYWSHRDATSQGCPLCRGAASR